MRIFLYTNSSSYIKLFISLWYFLFISCSPAIYILDKAPELVSGIYERSVIKIQKKISISPEDVLLLQNGVETLTTYAYGFLLEKSDRLILENYTEGKNLEKLAHDYFAEAIKYGDLALKIKYNNYPDWISHNSNNTSIKFKRSDFDLLYWTAAAYGGAISTSGGNPKWIIDLPRVGKLLNEIVNTDSSWGKGSALVALISFNMNNPIISQFEAEKQSKTLFLKAVKASSGNDMGPYVTYAESVSKSLQNRQEFIELLETALQIKVNSDKDLSLTNTISKNRAKWLLSNIDEFFY